MRTATLRALVITALTLTALTLTALAGCGDDTGNDTSNAAPTTAPAAFPATVQSEHGDVIIAKRPERIVSLSPSLTEILFAIGAGDQVEAVDKNSDHPAGVPTTDLSGFRPNVEAIAGFQPDLVALADDRDGIVTALTGLGIPTLLLSSPDHLDRVYDQITTLGAATGHRAGAQSLADTMRSKLTPTANRENDVRRRHYYELSATHHSVTSDTFIGEVLALAGLESIADGVTDIAGGYPQLSAEYVLDADPDVIFLAYAGGDTPTAEAVAARPGWDQLAAVRNHHVIVLDADLASRWGPRLVDLLGAVFDATAGSP